MARTEQSEGPIRLRPIGVEPRPAPFASASALEVWQAWEQGRLGSVSYGKPNRGGLYGGVRLQSNDWMQVRMPQRSWVTEEVAGQLAAALELLHTTHPDAPPLQVGDGSTRRGGWLRPHRSHQSGRDLDLGLFYLDPDTWYAKGTRKNLDIELNWALVKALLAAADVEYVFVDRSIIEMMREHALERGDSKELVESVLESPTHRGAPVRHTWGHRTHFHVRFHSNRAQAAAKRLHPLLERWGKL